MTPRLRGPAGYLPGLIYLLLAGWLAGCAPFTPQIPPPVRDQPPIEGWTADKLVEVLSQRDQQFRSIRSLAAIVYRGPEGRHGFDEAILVQRAERLRLETLSGLGSILVVTADGDQLIGFHPREGLFFRGRTTKENLMRYTQIPLELEEITALLMGLPPATAAPNWQIGGSSLYRDLEGDRKEIVTFDPDSALPVRWYRSRADGTPELSAIFEDFYSTPAGPFPMKITLEDALQRRSLEIRYRQPEINVEIPSALFNQEKPANVKEIPLEALGG